MTGDESEIDRLHREMVAGDHARAILEDEQVKAALELLTSEAIDGWEKTGAGAIEQREQFWLWLKVTRRFRDIFQVALEHGEAARHMLENIEADRKADMM